FFFLFPLAKFWRRIEGPVEITVVPVEAVMQMGREFARRARPAVPRTADPADHVTGFDDKPFGNGLMKTAQMCIIMVNVVDAADTDPPAAVAVPAFHFDDAVTGAAHGDPVAGEDVGSFVDAQPAPTPPGTPCAAVRIVGMQGNGKGV